MPYYEPFLILACFCAAAIDFLYYKIPNWLVLTIIIVYVVKAIMALVAGASFADFYFPFISFGIVLVAGFVLFALRIIGAGDAKLLAACSLWMAEINILQFILLTFIGGGVIALIYIYLHQGVDFLRNLVFTKIINKFGATQTVPTDKKAVPYAIAIFLGVVWVLKA